MRHFILLGLILLVPYSDQKPHIFREIDTCEIPVLIKDKTKYFTVPAVINARSGDFRFIVTLCNENSFMGQTGYLVSTISVYNKTSLYLNDTSVPKSYEASQDIGGILLQLNNEIKCKEDQNYLISIKMSQFNYKVPRLTINEDDCSLEIEIARSDYDPSCMKHIGGKWFIDLTPLRNKPISITNEHGERYLVSLCGPLRECGQQAGCKIGPNNDIEVIGLLKKLKVNFRGNVVEVYSSNDKPRKSMLITLKCRWDVQSLAKPKLLNEGTNHKFEVQSSYGCVKAPTKCSLTDENLHLFFDLTDLGAPAGTVVTNTTRNIKLNICGDLKMNWPRNLKNSMERSQVCEITGKKYVNRGSNLNLGLNEGILRARLVDGNECNENETYSTIVDFKCSSKDTGPVFNSDEGCSTKLTWETPKACPKFQIIQNSCTFSSVYGNLNLNELHKSDGFSYDISPRQKLVYNLCGKIQSKCSSFDDVSVCLHDGNTQRVIGWNKPFLSFVNGELKLEYRGEKCDHDDIPYSFTMHLVCSFDENKVEPVVKRVDSCSFVSTVYTSSACLTPWEIKNCTVDEENSKYDLSPLIRRTKNYMIRDGRNGDITYFMNLCAPLLPEKDSVFFANSMVYMLNSTVSSITERYTPIGYIADPAVKDGKLVVEATMGKKCNSTTTYSSRISFECSEQEMSPYFSGMQGCRAEFVWGTRHACPIMKKGGSCTLSSGNLRAQVPGDPIEIKIDQQSTYFFSLCLDSYRWCRSGGDCTTRRLSKNVQLQNEGANVQYTLNDSRLLQTVSFKVECDPFKVFNYTKFNTRSNHVDIVVKARIPCINGEQTARTESKRDEVYEYKIMKELDQEDENQPIDQHVNLVKASRTNKTERNITKDNKPQAYVDQKIETKKYEVKQKIADNVKNDDQINITKDKLYHETHKDIQNSTATTIKERKICAISNAQGGNIDLYDLDSLEFKNGSDNYIFNFNGGSAKCMGFICKNGDDIVRFITRCPEVSYRDDRTILKYTTDGQCIMDHPASWSNMVVELSLGCSEKNVTATAFERGCKVTFDYFSPKICYSKSSNGFAIFIIAIFLVFIIFSLTVFVLYRFNYFRKCSYDSVSENDALVVHSKVL